MSLLISFCFLQHHFYVPTMHYLASCRMLKGVIITLSRRSIHGRVCQWDRGPGCVWRLANWTTRVIHLLGWGGRYSLSLFVLWRWHIKNHSGEKPGGRPQSVWTQELLMSFRSFCVSLLHQDLFGYFKDSWDKLCLMKVWKMNMD